MLWHPVGQLHQQDPDVVGHGQDHLADIFRLLGLPVAEDQLADLGDPVDHVRHFLAEVFFQIVQGGGGVLHRVVEQTGGDGDGPQAHLGQVIGHFQGVGQVGLAAQAQLAFMGLGGKDVGLLNEAGIRLRVILLHLLHDVLEADDPVSHAVPGRFDP